MRAFLVKLSEYGIISLHNATIGNSLKLSLINDMSERESLDLNLDEKIYNPLDQLK